MFLYILQVVLLRTLLYIHIHTTVDAIIRTTQVEPKTGGRSGQSYSDCFAQTDTTESSVNYGASLAFLLCQSVPLALSLACCRPEKNILPYHAVYG